MATPTPGGILDRLASAPERAPRALLLTGPSEAELERASRELAARMLCPNDDPEGACGSCRRVQEGLHPDFLSIEPEGLQIKIDRIREALAFGAGRPYEATCRVARILQAELLGLEASNALLKSLEEPGARFRWILSSTRPEQLLSTIRSRVARVRIRPAAATDRERAWQARGFSPEDAEDLLRFGLSEQEEEPQGRLQESRERRAAIAGALEAGLVDGRITSLLLLAEPLERDLPAGRLLAELLADAAVSTASVEAMRHAPVAGTLARIARNVGPDALRRAAVAAADPPADRRRGNRRLHYEKLLIELWGARKLEA